MIDLRELRADPERFQQGATAKGFAEAPVVDLVSCDERLRAAITEQQELTAEKNKIGKQIGRIASQLKKGPESERDHLRAEMKRLQQRPHEIKQREGELSRQVSGLQARRDALWLEVPQPPDPQVPVGVGSEENIELKRWKPDWFDPSRSFEENKGFAPLSHIELGQRLGLIDFERGVKAAGSRSYMLVGNGMRLHQAILRYAFDYMINEHGFTPLSVPTLVRDQMMVGTGFFPHGRDQVYDIANPTGEGYGQALTGTGEVGLMSYRADEILDADELPLTYTTISTCYRREAGSGGKDTAGLFRIHEFDKVEQVVICRADEQESRSWHQKMIGFVEALMQRLELPHRLLQCCTGDLGPKNVDQVDIEAWMPSRGPVGKPTGAYGETHSASRIHDYQCRRLNIRYRDRDTKKTVVCHALNNTVAASPRILIPIMELYQNKDGSITVPRVLRPLMNDMERIEP